jgi:hypothetical protein
VIPRKLRTDPLFTVDFRTDAAGGPSSAKAMADRREFGAKSLDDQFDAMEVRFRISRLAGPVADAKAAIGLQPQP